MTSQIQQNVMRRVHTIHAIRPLISGGAFAAVLSIGSLYFIGREVWVARVFQNMPHSADVLNIARFFLAAFMNTRSIVQVLVLLTIAGGVWFARELYRALPVIRFA